LSKQEQEKQKYTGPLYVKPPTAPGTISHKPPPRRGGAVGAVESEEKVRASYDYDGGELEDLPCREGEELVVVERGESSSCLMLQSRERRCESGS